MQRKPQLYFENNIKGHIREENLQTGLIVVFSSFLIGVQRVVFQFLLNTRCSDALRSLQLSLPRTTENSVLIVSHLSNIYHDMIEKKINLTYAN